MPCGSERSYREGSAPTTWRAIWWPGWARRGSRWTWRFTTSGCPARSAIRSATRCGRRATAGYRCGSPSTTTRRSPSRGRSSRRRRGRSRRCWSSSACRSPPIPGWRDLMHHKYVVRDGAAVWTGSTNWTLDSWEREENVLVAVDSPELAAAYARNFNELWEKRHVGNSGNFDTPDNAGVRPWFCPGRGPELSHRIAKRIGAAQRRRADRHAGADRRADPRHAVRADRRGAARHRRRVRRDPDPPGLPAVGGQPAARSGRRRCCGGR